MLRQRRWSNLSEPSKAKQENRYYAQFGGIEWEHGDYGARDSGLMNGTRSRDGKCVRVRVKGATESCRDLPY